jgi:hypothetical protein
MSDRRDLVHLALAVVVIAGTVTTEVTDAQERHRHREREHGQEQTESSVLAAESPVYRELCGACHFALQPGLLPARSWQRLLVGTDDHFGQALGLEPAQLGELETYLTANAAERTPGELARDILESVGSSTPLRVTEVPAIRHEHRRIDPSVYRRPAVAGRANCPACHPNATAGRYDDDTVAIPPG